MVVVAIALVAAACGGSKDKPVPTVPPTEPPSTTVPPSTTTPIVTLPGSPRTSTTVPASLGPGGASLSGTVNGPDGAVSGATVVVERLAGQRPASATMRTDDNGSWSIDSVLGGAYRVRAYKSPELGQISPLTFFLGADERRSVAVNLNRFGDNSITASVDPRPPMVDQPTTLVITVGTGRIGEDGTPTIQPRPAARLQLLGGEGVAVEEPSSQLTDGDGHASFRVHCTATGIFQLTLVVGGGVTRFQFPECVAAPAPPG